MTPSSSPQPPQAPTGEATPPRFAVVMPVYNGAATLERAATSILGQSERSLELLIVDDCSTDASPGIAAAIAASDPRVKLLRTPANSGGPATAKNLGLRCATADIVTFCDQDDRHAPDKLARTGAVFDAHPDTDLLFSDYWVEDQDSGEPPYRYLGERRTFLQRAAPYLEPLGDGLYACRRFLGCMAAGIETGIATLTVAIRRSVLAGLEPVFDTRYRITDDIDLWHRLAATVNVKYLDRCLATYTAHAQSLSSRRDLVAVEAVAVHAAVDARWRGLLTADELRAHRAMRSRLVYRLAVVSLEAPRRSLALAWQSFRLKPSKLALFLIGETALRSLAAVVSPRSRRPS